MPHDTVTNSQALELPKNPTFGHAWRPATLTLPLVYYCTSHTGGATPHALSASTQHCTALHAAALRHPRSNGVQLSRAQARLTHPSLMMLAPRRLFFGGLPGWADGLPPAGHTQRNQANPTAGGPSQSLTSEIRLTPLSQEVPSARTKKTWELNPHTSLLCYSNGYNPLCTSTHKHHSQSPVHHAYQLWSHITKTPTRLTHGQGA
jgi:hypothetical protein